MTIYDFGDHLDLACRTPAGVLSKPERQISQNTLPDGHSWKSRKEHFVGFAQSTSDESSVDLIVADRPLRVFQCYRKDRAT